MAPSQSSIPRGEREDVKLRDHLTELVEGLDKRIDQRLIAMERVNEIRFEALEKMLNYITDANDKAHTSMNEFRGVIGDQAKSFITRTDYETLRNSFDKDMDLTRKDIEDLKLSRAELAGKANQSQLTTTFIISLLGVLIGIIGIILKFIK